MNASEIVPMIIDTDVNNGNLKTYKDLSRYYSTIYDHLYSNSDIPTDKHFFKTKVRESVDLSIDGRQFETLQGMINYNGLNNHHTKSLIDLLFSKQNLEMPLEKGFVGNPNIGSIVINHIINNSEEFKKFTQAFAEGDRIFIVSSIFGGTGAAGFPLLLKNFRYNEEIEKFNIISNAIIGAVTVLPYFAVSKQEDEADKELDNYQIDSNTFIVKSKAALAYYDKYVKKDINALYFIGDYKRSTYKNQKGGEKQNNPAYFIELAAAQSIIDFMNLEPEKNKFSEMKFQDNFFEFSVNSDTDQIDFTELFEETNFTRPFVKHHIFRHYFKEYFVKSLNNKNLTWRVDLNIDPNFAKSELCNNLSSFYSLYDKWIEDMKFDQHARKYTPFKPEKATEKNILSLFNGKQPKMNRSFLGKESIPEIEFDKVFNDEKKSNTGNIEQKFMFLMSNGVDTIYQKNFHN